MYYTDSIRFDFACDVVFLHEPYTFILSSFTGPAGLRWRGCHICDGPLRLWTMDVIQGQVLCTTVPHRDQGTPPGDKHWIHGGSDDVW